MWPNDSAVLLWADRSTLKVTTFILITKLSGSMQVVFHSSCAALILKFWITQIIRKTVFILRYFSSFLPEDLVLLKETLSKESSARKSRSEILLAFECFLMYFQVPVGSPFKSYIMYNLSVYFTSMIKKKPLKLGIKLIISNHSLQPSFVAGLPWAVE